MWAQSECGLKRGRDIFQRPPKFGYENWPLPAWFTNHTPGWNYVQLDATRDKPSETIPCRNGDLVPER